MPAAEQARLAKLRVVHDHEHIFVATKAKDAAKDRSRYVELPPVSHPLVHVHPVTKRPALFMSPHTMARVEGMDEAAGQDLLEGLIAHATEDRFVYRHRWSDHDILMWDNRAVMHAVQPFDNARVRRRMHRVTLTGETKPAALV